MLGWQRSLVSARVFPEQHVQLRKLRRHGAMAVGVCSRDWQWAEVLWECPLVWGGLEGSCWGLLFDCHQIGWLWETGWFSRVQYSVGVKFLKLTSSNSKMLVFSRFSIRASVKLSKRFSVVGFCKFFTWLKLILWKRRKSEISTFSVEKPHLIQFYCRSSPSFNALCELFWCLLRTLLRYNF